MEDFKLLFEKVDDGDREGLSKKVLIAAKALKICAIVAIGLTLLIGIPLILLSGVVGGALLSEVGEGVALVGDTAIVTAAVVLLAISLIGQILTIWYSEKIKRDLEDGIFPSLIIPYILVAVNLLSLYNSISSGSGILGIVISGFLCYLWYIIISVAGKLKNMVE